MSTDVKRRIWLVFCERVHEKKEVQGSIILSWKSLSGQSSLEWARKRREWTKKMMAASPLAMGAVAHWASPRQSCGGNNCGIWMLMIATDYSAAVWVRVFTRVTDNDDYEAASVVSLVDTAAFGQRGRAHIVESLRTGKIQDSSAARSILVLFLK
jgi:hypothetical protein